MWLMKIPTLRMEQFGETLYLTQMSAKQLGACAQMHEWNPDLKWDITKQGFQRAPVEAHYQAIGKFLAESVHPFIPTAALLSAQESEQGLLPFRQKYETSGVAFGELTIKEGRQLLILDYQHRLRGLQHAIEDLGATQLEDFTMPVIILPDIPKFEQIRQFYLINSKQRRIDTDLALALLQTLAGDVDEQELYNLVGAGKRFRIRATRLTFKFAERNRKPWAGRIMQPHDLPQPKGVIKVKSFVDSLATVVSKRWSCSSLDDEPLLDALTNFWLALVDLIPTAFENPRDHQIQRTVGVFAFHLVFARRVYPNCENQGRVSRRGFKDELSLMPRKYLNEKFWRTGGDAGVFTGSSGYRELFNLIIAKIPDTST